MKLNFAERSYEILIGRGLLQEAGRWMREAGLKGRVMVVTNPTVAKWYLEPLLHSLASAGYEAQTAEIPDGEIYKAWEQANTVFNHLVEAEYDRKSIIVALGGGVVGDLAGFVAATYMRGIKLVQVPTTLLAQVDSSVGGKVAINHPKGKNLIGAFYQPGLVLTDVDALQTLPPRELHAGMAEVIKHGLILDEEYYHFILSEAEAIRRTDPEIMTAVVRGSCKIKAAVVMQDETEGGFRAILNFGHTLGHAYESLTGYNYYKHGEAVALGMLAATKIATRQGLLGDERLEPSLVRIMRELELPLTIPGLPVAEIMQRIYLDKKVEYGKLRWIMPQRIGKAEITSDITQPVVEQVLREMGASA